MILDLAMIDHIRTRICVIKFDGWEWWGNENYERRSWTTIWYFYTFKFTINYMKPPRLTPVLLYVSQVDNPYQTIHTNNKILNLLVPCVFWSLWHVMIFIGLTDMIVKIIKANAVAARIWTQKVTLKYVGLLVEKNLVGGRAKLKCNFTLLSFCWNCIWKHQVIRTAGRRELCCCWSLIVALRITDPVQYKSVKTEQVHFTHKIQVWSGCCFFIFKQSLHDFRNLDSICVVLFFLSNSAPTNNLA